MRSDVAVRHVQSSDEIRWRELFHAYRSFYRLAPSEEIVTRVWGWLNDPGHELHGLVAAIDEMIVGIAHYRLFSRPSTGSVGIWLDDLFTDSETRGRGAGRTLLGQLEQIAEAGGSSVVRWMTAEDNLQAKKLYDGVATRTSWVIYDIVPNVD